MLPSVPDDAMSKIPIVDDHPDNLLATTAVLGTLNQDLVTVSSGREALKALLDKDEFAVIIMDVQMRCEDRPIPADGPVPTRGGPLGLLAALTELSQAPRVGRASISRAVLSPSTKLLLNSSSAYQDLRESVLGPRAKVSGPQRDLVRHHHRSAHVFSRHFRARYLGHFRASRTP